ncbi:MAG: cupin domain-containing protein [Gemmatimonadota bacterium]
MHLTRQADLPFVGMSHQFIGADHDIAVSSYIVNAPPGRGPRLHRHPYDKLVFVQQGVGRWTADGVEVEAGPGDILVVKAGEVHTFVSLGPEPLIQFDIHLAPRFEQENLD